MIDVHKRTHTAEHINAKAARPHATHTPRNNVIKNDFVLQPVVERPEVVIDVAESKIVM